MKSIQVLIEEQRICVDLKYIREVVDLMINRALVNPDVFEAISPFLSGMSLREINDLLEHMSSDTMEEFEEWAAESGSSKYKVFLDINREVIKDYLQKGR